VWRRCVYCDTMWQRCVARLVESERGMTTPELCILQPVSLLYNTQTRQAPIGRPCVEDALADFRNTRYNKQRKYHQTLSRTPSDVPPPVPWWYGPRAYTRPLFGLV